MHVPPPTLPPPQLLQEQNLELAERLAEMQAFISHQAQSVKTAKTANVATFLKTHRSKQQAGAAAGEGSRR